MAQFNYKDGVYHLNGHCTLSEVPQLHNELKPSWLQGSGDITVDLSAVDKADSSILALLLEWKSKAIQSNRQFVIISIPPSLTGLTKMSGIDKLL
jgi:Predicted NTP binding protein (contains STAS domain)